MTSIVTRQSSKNKPAKLSKSASAGAQMLADAIESYADPASKPGKRGHSFASAYRSIGDAVPEQERLSVFLEMEKELAEVIAALQKDFPDGGLSGNDAMADLRRQERAMRERDVEAGRLVSPATLTARLGITPQALSAAVRARRMFALTGPSGERLYPWFFADAKYERRDLEKVSKALGGLAGSVKWAFFMTPKISLGNKRPLDVLHSKMERVLSLAAGLLEE